MNDYIYQPLVHEDQIRVLTLMPGSGRDPIEGTINCIRLSSIPVPNHQAPVPVWRWGHKQFGEDSIFGTDERGRPTVVRVPRYIFECDRAEYTSRAYDALSYAWGDPEQVEEILVNGKRLGTARNLHTGLLRLRHPKERRRLWIDAICINQGDNHERNHQVGMMQRIYSAASSVIVWLADPTSDLALTLRMILDYNNSLKNKKDKGAIFSYKQTALRGLGMLFQKTWWRRIWIVQEVVAARELVIVLGRTTFPWVYLREICSAIYKREFTNHALAPLLRSCGFQKFRDLDSFRATGAMPVVHLLRSTQNYQATDPRDKLYALLGMTSDISTEDIVPDYSRPVRKVFQDLVQFMAVRRGSLDLLCLGQCLSPVQVQSWLPSWQTVAGGQPFGGTGRLYQAARDTQAVVDMSEFPHTLIVEGVLSDAVEMFGGSVTIAHECASTIQRWQYLSTQAKKCCYRDFLELIVAGEDSQRLWFQQELDYYGLFASADPGVYKSKLEAVLQHAGNARSRETQKLSDTITRTVMGRRFFTTKKGRIGLGPAGVQMGDAIAVLKGCHVPLIIRARQDHWIIVGEAYVVGMMSGEVLSGPLSGNYGPRMIALK